VYLLDTNVISQLARRKPDAHVVAFINKAKETDTPLYLSVLTIGEIKKGIAKLVRSGDHGQSDRLQQWLTQLHSDLAEYLLPIDADTCTLWGTILAITDDTNAIDKLLAATALQYDLTLVTRNIDHMQGSGARCFNPFAAAG
jgi:predicted nucleic acid-binding protein